MNMKKLNYHCDIRNTIAVIGMACRLPGANNVDEYWNILKNGHETISHFSKETLRKAGISNESLKNHDYVRSKGILKGIEYFDAKLFEFNEYEARITDPQQRIFLELAYEAIEDSGYLVDHYQGDIGVYAGMSRSTYYVNNLQKNHTTEPILNDTQTIIATQQGFLATKIAYKLNLKGPAININTACSTSLVAVNIAIKELLNYECDIALAGGVSVYVPQISGYLYIPGDILSPDGHCSPFSARANGTVPANGAGIVVLKRLDQALKDHDKIEALIIGSAINNDGAHKTGFTAPSVEGQAECINEAMMIQDILPSSVSYIEAHGTGTAIGDEIEFEALKLIYASQTNKKQFCAIGAGKSNIGHTDSAAGIAGLIKAVLALKNQYIPKTLHAFLLNF